MKTKIVFATGNIDKMKEIREILEGVGADILSMAQAGISMDIEEDGTTFEENALIKAKAVAGKTDAIVLADDSGLEIDFLDKQPGIHSARFMGKNTSYDKKNRELIKKLKGVPKERRTARFVCAIASAVPGQGIVTTRGTVEGYIGFQPAGESGFGYDPIFYVDEYGCSTAQLAMEQKNAFSHRGNALRAMKKELDKRGVFEK